MQHEWQHGRWTAAVQKHSPNHSPRPAGEAPYLVVLHNISLPPFQYGTGAVAKLFTNTLNPAEHPFFAAIGHLRVSSHFFISRSGTIEQFVSCDQAAHHAGRSQFHGRTQCNAYSIGIEIEGCDFEPFAEAQYQSLFRLLAALQAAYPICAVTGHQDIAPDRKTDPGHFFDWQRLQRHGIPIDRNRNTLPLPAAAP